MTFLRSISILLLAGASYLNAEMIFHEPFDFDSSVAILGNQNGWQASFDKAGPSPTLVKPNRIQQASPFPEVGYAIMANSSGMTNYRRLPDSLNGRNLFFSYTMKAYSHRNISGLRFRADDGLPLLVGFSKGEFAAVLGNISVTAEPSIELRKSYFIVGQIQVSADGNEVGIAARAYTSSDQVATNPPSATSEWPLLLTHRVGAKARNWNGVDFMSASANTAFDDLRIGEAWFDVAGKR